MKKTEKEKLQVTTPTNILNITFPEKKTHTHSPLASSQVSHVHFSSPLAEVAIGPALFLSWRSSFFRAYPRLSKFSLDVSFASTLLSWNVSLDMFLAYGERLFSWAFMTISHHFTNLIGNTHSYRFRNMNKRIGLSRLPVPNNTTDPLNWVIGLILTPTKRSWIEQWGHEQFCLISSWHQADAFHLFLNIFKYIGKTHIL